MCEVTEMNDDFISRAETIKALQALIGAAVTGPEQALVEAAVHVAESVPKADVKQVRHGKWKWCGEDRWNDAYQCSECGKMNMDNSNYCPNCGGGKMGLEDLR